jgi:UDP-GlcNAc:undecaprenyl-phosphate/decaprenyl-phosphate GlcNAc-1-phosphate transferase
MIVLIEWLLAGMTIWFAAATGVILVRRWAEHRHILDVPNARSSHRHPTPRGGGLAIAVVTLAGVLIYNLVNPAPDWSGVIAYVFGATLIASVSLVDDLRSVPASLRLVAQALGAVLAVVGLGYWNQIAMPFWGPISLGWLGLPLTLVWIVGVTNAFNFIDGIDGLAGGQAVVAGLGWFAIGGMSGQLLTSVLGLLLAISSLGFLRHNWPPARIFLGDVGSAFLGYTLGILPLVGPQHDPRLPLTAVLLYWPILFDTGFTFVRRLLRRENVFVAHRSHLYQRLIIVGYRHLQVTWLYVAYAISYALLAFAWITYLHWSGAASVLFVCSLSAILWLFVIRQEQKQQGVKATVAVPVQEAEGELPQYSVERTN